MDNEFLLQDRIQKIRQIIRKYGEENFYLSFSGGKDSTVLSALLDMAIPENKIPRVYANTGIELNMIRDFVFSKAEKDDRFKIIAPTVPIKPMLERDGYPFKSKKHSQNVATYQKYGTLEGREGLKHYLHIADDGRVWKSQHSCPEKLKYQFTPEFKLKLSDKCCVRMKEEPLSNWGKENNKPYTIIGLMREEGGEERTHNVLFFVAVSSKLSNLFHR